MTTHRGPWLLVLVVAVALLPAPARGQGCFGVALAGTEPGVTLTVARSSGASSQALDMMILLADRFFGTLGLGSGHHPVPLDGARMQRAGAALVFPVGPAALCPAVGVRISNGDFRDEFELDQGMVDEVMARGGVAVAYRLFQAGPLRASVHADTYLLWERRQMEGRRLLVEGDQLIPEQIAAVETEWGMDRVLGLTARWGPVFVDIAWARHNGARSYDLWSGIIGLSLLPG